MMKKALLILSVLAINQLRAQFCFTSNTTYSVNNQPLSVACADFNNDGIKDVITSNIGSADISLLLGQSGGGFGAPSNTVICSGIGAVFTADFNVDGKADLAVLCSNVKIMLGNGNGTFQTATSYSTASVSPSSVAAADFNNDGNLDLIVPDMNSNQASLLLGNGSGGFSSPSIFGVGHWSRCVAAADFNGDGNADFVTGNDATNDVSVLLGDGLGGFAPKDSFPAGNYPYSIAAADFNNDSHIDLAVVNKNGNNVSIMLGTGTGAFGAPTNFTVGSSPNGIECADIDADGILDIVVANNNLNNVSILKGNGNGTFATAYNVSTGSHPADVKVADMDGDGSLDIVAANTISNNVTEILGCTPTSTCVVSVSYNLYPDTVPGYWVIVPQYSALVDSAVWDWGDGSQTTGLYPSHTYTVPPGFYNKCVTVYSNCGDTSVACANDSIYRFSPNSMIYVNVLPSAPNSIRQNGDAGQGITFYPNPATDRVILETEKDAWCELYNNEGKCVLQVKCMRRKAIDVSQLKAGMYYWRLRSAETITYRKQMINH